MKIDELDEWQGLTREMVDHYLNRNGWCNMPDPDQRLLKPQYAHVSFKMGLGAAIERIAAIVGSTPQALLREINPRMRKGWPSGNALAMHDRWIVRKPDGAVIVCRWRPPYMVNAAGGADSARMISVNFALREQCEQWEFWPCDEHGNKVRWPTDAEGKML